MASSNAAKRAKEAEEAMDSEEPKVVKKSKPMPKKQLADRKSVV